jgi:S-DNA-T family DNA segregation ATPase FtsK/SpoIIIE
MVRLAEVSGIVVAGLAGFGKTMLVAHQLGQLAPSPAVQFVLIDGKGGPDYDRLTARAWLSAKDDLEDVRGVLRQVHRLMLHRQGTIAQVLGETDAWKVGPSPSWPLVVVVIDGPTPSSMSARAPAPRSRPTTPWWPSCRGWSRSWSARAATSPSRSCC